jgi:3-oxoadipate enol-lactonase
MRAARVRPDVELAYRVSGQERVGTPLMFLAPLARDHSVLDTFVAEFETSRRCLWFDYRGTGASSDPPGPYSVAVLAEDSARLLVHIESGGAHVIGISMGAAVALELALHAPRLVESLVLVTPWAATDDALRRVFIGLASESATGQLEQLERRIGDLVFSESSLQANQEDIARLVASCSYPSRQAMIAHFEAAIGHDVRHRLDAVNCPTLVIAGEKDTFIPSVYASEVRDGIAGCRYVLIAGAGSSHGLTVERTTDVVGHIEEFLSNL